MKSRPHCSPRLGHAMLLLAAATCLSQRAAIATQPIDWKLGVNSSPLRPTSEDSIRLVVTGDSTLDCTALAFLEPPEVEGFRIRLQGRRGNAGILCAPYRWENYVVLPLLAPGAYRLELMDHELPIFSQQLDVGVPQRSLTFLDGIVATLRLTDPRAGEPREVAAMQLTEDAGYFWFFAPENIEVTLKLLDGRPVNGHYWLFLSGMTDLGLTIEVTKMDGCPPDQCPKKTYVNQPGKRLNRIDTNLF